MGAIWARTRAGFRASSRRSIALVLLIGFTGAVVMASAAGARRTDSVWDRFRSETHAPDVTTISCPLGRPWPTVDLDQVGTLPEVEESARIFATMGYITDATGRSMFYDEPSIDVGTAGPADAASWEKMKVKVLEGRVADPNSTSEVTVGYMASPDPAARVGEVIYFHPVRPDADVEVVARDSDLGADLFGEPIALTVVGITLASGIAEQITGNSPDVTATPAFLAAYGDRAMRCEGIITWLENGLEDTNAVLDGIQRIEPEAVIGVAGDEASFVRRNTRPSAVVLWIFAGLVGFAGLVVFGQIIARQTWVEATENPTLRALGMTRTQLMGVSATNSLIIAASASAVAAVLATAASAMFPFGLAAVAEPSPGIEFDTPVIVGGALLIGIIVVLAAAFPAWRAGKIPGDSSGLAVPADHEQPSTLATAAARAGLAPSAVIGVRLALEPGRGRTAVPVKSAIVGLSVAFVALSGSLIFAGSFDHMLATPDLLGITFDVGAGNPFIDSVDEGVRRAFATDPGLRDVAGGNFAFSAVVEGPDGAGATLNMWGLEQITGEQHPPAIEGRWPTDVGEIALGSTSMRELGAGIGDRVSVSAGSNRTQLTVVGRVVFPDFGFGPGLGEGAGVTFDQLQGVFPEAQENLFLANLADGVSLEEVAARIQPVIAEYGMDLGSSEDNAASESIEEIKGSRRVPQLLAGVLAVLAVAMLAHTLLLSIRRRRRDLAILKTLGLTNGQVSLAVAWQASTLVLISLVVGIPLGIILGRWAWNAFAGQLGVFPFAVVPVGWVLAIVPVALLAANLIALWPGRAAGRAKPSVVLRSE